MKSMDKETFVQQYVLTRAGAINSGFDADGCVKTAIRIFNEINRVCEKEKENEKK